ncbi:Reverse rubrerythrin-1 [Methanosarcinales archaeon]|nr:rubrerythrin family protein [Candidatus Methanoperedens sp.]CAG0953557.1 Reverse rubrerythrin-1 [Methanosarcinales archaeon]
MIDYTKESKLSVKSAVEKMQTMEIMEKTFDLESNDIALYLAMSKRAEEEGEKEIAAYLFNIAMDEASHAAQFAALLGMVKDTRTNLLNMLAGEIQAEKDKSDASEVAFGEGNDEAFKFFEKSMKDETRHKEGIKKILSKLQAKD